MFVPNVRSILEARKQARELCKPGVLKAVAHNCPGGNSSLNQAAEHFGPMIAALSVPLIVGSLCLVWLTAMWPYHIHRRRGREEETPRLETIQEMAEGEETLSWPDGMEVRSRKRKMVPFRES